MNRLEDRRRRIWICNWAAVMFVSLAPGSGQAADFDHLVAGKLTGGERVDSGYQADVDAVQAALDVVLSVSS